MILSAEILMFRLPCDCTADSDAATIALIVKGQGIVECPWCGAAFSQADFAEWFAADKLVRVERGGRSLMRFGGDLMEVVDRCGCGAPMVRGQGSTMEPTHLSVEPRDVEFLRN